MRATLSALVTLALVAGLVIAVVPTASAEAEPRVRAGVAVVDATWHVGASGGQYAGWRTPPEELTGDTDPHAHHTKADRSYGVQSRLTIRALVVEGSNGERVALVKTDNYLAQDHLLRRVAQLLEGGDSGIAYPDIFHAASHNHSSPYYATPSWGVWLFQDVWDLRFFEYQARAMAQAIEEAAASLAPARMGATTIRHDTYKGNIMRPQTAHDGSPVGFPSDYGDAEIAVLRFDGWAPETEAGWEPLAVWMNHGQHPESLDDHDLITADFLAPLERFVEQDTGAALVFSQGDVGSAEGPYDSWHHGRMDDGTLVAWAHIGHAQTERGARILADSVVQAYEQIGRGEGTVPFSTDFEVGVVDGWVPGPVSHPYPSVSNCRTERTAEGDPGAPILGLPDCERAGFPPQRNPLIENLKAHGIPVPDHYDAPSFTGVQENLRIRLQVVKLGDVVLGSCACEAQVDLILNFESRANDTTGDIHDGFDWREEPRTTCEQAGDGTWTCTHVGPQDRERTWTFSDAAYQRMHHQIHNDAAGWDALEYAPYANSEPTDPTQIKGNFTKLEIGDEELGDARGYTLAIGVGHAGDYNGYTVSYREYMAYDHYRKALTSHGAHTADYMVTRLVRMAAELNGGPPYEGEPNDAQADADEARQEATARALGQASSAAYDAWLTSLPTDVGPAEAVVQPDDISRFEAAHVTWRGGSNAVDNPQVRVQRFVDGQWRDHAGMEGEIPTMLDFPDGVAGVADTYTGRQEWFWTASFEAFTGGPDPTLENTPPGTYRFVVDGHIRDERGGEEPARAYTIESEPFEVSVWDGIRVEDLRVEGDTVSFAVTSPDGAATRYGLGDRWDIDYPLTYPARDGAPASPFPYIRDDGQSDVCETCSFRAWAFGNDIVTAEVTVRRPNGESTYSATRDGDRWVVSGLKLRPHDEVYVAAGGVVDAAGNVNGEASDVVPVAPPGKVVPER